MFLQTCKYPALTKKKKKKKTTGGHAGNSIFIDSHQRVSLIIDCAAV